MILVKVTQEDIDNGWQFEGYACPIAIALTRATGMPWCVCNEKAGNEDVGMIELPFDARVFIEAFDRGEVVQPFQFPIEV